MENLQPDSNIEQLTIDELYQQLGFLDYSYIELNSQISNIEMLREQIISKIRKYHATNTTDQNLHSAQ